MSKFKNVNNYKFWHSPLALLLLLGVVILFGYSVFDLIKKSKETRERREILEEEIVRLEERSTSLEKEISRLETEEGKEEVIRNKYPFARSGEKMVTIIDDQSKVDEEKEDKEAKSFWITVKDLFE